MSHTSLEDLRQRLSGIDKSQLVELLTSALAGEPQQGDATASAAVAPIVASGTALGAKMPIAEYFDARYRIIRQLASETVREYHNCFRAFHRWLKRTPTLIDVAQKIPDFLYARSKQVSVQTLKKYRGHFLAVLHAADEDGLIKLPRNVPKFVPPDHIVKAFLPDELVKLIEGSFALGTDGVFCRAGILLAYDTGARRRDVFSFTWDQLDEAAGTITWIVHKSQRVHTAAVRPETIQCFHALRPHALPGDNRLIPFGAGVSENNRPWTWMRLWRRLGKAAGVDTHKRGLQAIRRTGASLVHAAGEDASRYLSHAPSSNWLADKFYLDRRIARPQPVAPSHLRPSTPTPHATFTHATTIGTILGEFLTDVGGSLPRSVLTMTENAVREWCDLVKIEGLGGIRAESAAEYASALHHDGFSNIHIGLKLQALSRVLTWLVEKRGCAEPNVIECWKSTIRTEGHWRPPTAHPAREQTY